MSLPARPEARMVVGLDFGTTFSGFAFAHRSSPQDVFVETDWPKSGEGGGKPGYCKTTTSLYYKPSSTSHGRRQLQLDSWGWQAVANYTKDLDEVQKKQAPAESLGKLVTKFKLHLADKGCGPLSAEDLPQGLTTKQVITDFLRRIGEHVIEHLRMKYGHNRLHMEDVQWCVTVPSIWGDRAKQQMKLFMEGAGLVGGHNGSSHPVVMVLEPEAAAVYCLKTLTHIKLRQGDRFLVADIGGGTADIVVHQKANASGNLQVREVTPSSGGLCGGTYVDKSFRTFLSKKIGCLDTFLVGNPKVGLQLQKWWETLKCTFDGSDSSWSQTCELTNRLCMAWEKHDEKLNLHSGSYDEVEFSYADVVSIFKEVVDKNISLIKAQLSQTTDVKLILVVGGFSGSKYLMKKITEAFPQHEIMSPAGDPGRAICDGAVTIGLFPDNLLSRVARRTYGVETSDPFQAGDPERSASFVDSVKYCTEKFKIYVKVGQQVDADACVDNNFSPLFHQAKALTFRVFSSEADSPTYTTDDDVKLEGEFEVDISDTVHLDKDRSVKVSMFFGHSSIEVRAVPLNFGSGEMASMLPVKFDMGWA